VWSAIFSLLTLVFVGLTLCICLGLSTPRGKITTERLTMTHKVCEDTSMMRFIQKHGLLDGDFVLPIVALTLLLTMRGMI